MKKCVLLLSVLCFIVAGAISSAQAAEWRLPVGLTYASGFNKAVDIYEDNLEAEGYIVESSDSYPVGVSFQPYKQFDNGLGFGGGIGPFMLILSSADGDLLVVPVNIALRYTFLHEANVSPYIRLGLGYNIASGDYVEGSTPGLIGGIGIEFLRNKLIGFGSEISYDSSKIELEKVRDNSTEKISPGGFMVSVFAVF